MSLDVLGRARTRALSRRHGLRRRLAGGLITAVAALLATAAAASAYTPTPIQTNGSWSPNPCCNARHPGWYKDAFGIVHLQGAVSQLSANGPALITTLPPAARPNRAVFEIVHTFGGTYADISIDTQGRVGIIAPRTPEKEDLSFVSLEGITYQTTDQIPVTPVNVNVANWVQNWGPQNDPNNPNKSFGASNPGWYEDGAGFVHLEGATKQWNAQGNSFKLLGSLPPQAAPGVAVTVLAHTLNGTYAPLVITAVGQIFDLGARAPGTNDPSFLSLEGITFRPGSQFFPIGQINGTDWKDCSADQGFGWFEDKAGIVHLHGCGTEVSTGGSDPYTIGSVPPIAAPDKTVFEVVESDGGEYADVAISPDGKIRLVGVPATGFDSPLLFLDRVTYQVNDFPGPQALSLTRSGDVLALLHKPRKLELAVFKLGAHAHQLGTVRPGHAPAGRSRFRWNLSVDGHRLTAGTYIAELLAVPARGAAIDGGPGVRFALTGRHRLRVLSSTCSVAQSLRHRC